MTEAEAKPKYYDLRADFWRGFFLQAKPYDAYLDESDPKHADKWRAIGAQQPALSPDQTGRLAQIRRQLNVLVYTGVWCGDCVRQGPMFDRIARAAGELVDLRWIDRDVSEALQDELRVLGALRVPMLVFLTEDFFEVGRFGDRSLAIYRMKEERELGATCDTGLIPHPTDVAEAEQAEWVDIFERMLLMARLSPPLRERHGD